MQPSCWTSGGQGGVVFSRDKALVDAVRDYREFDCRDDQTRASTFQMTDLQAAVGRVQLSRLPEFLTRRDDLYKIYQSCGLTMLDSAESGHSAARLRAVVRSLIHLKTHSFSGDGRHQSHRSHLAQRIARHPRTVPLTRVNSPQPLSHYHVSILTDDEAWRIASIDASIKHDPQHSSTGIHAMARLFRTRPLAQTFSYTWTRFSSRKTASSIATKSRP